MTKYHCCIPGCKAYDTVNNFLIIPSLPYWREQWLAAIPRKDWVADSSTLACKKHFNQLDVAFFTTVKIKEKGKNGLKNSQVCTKAIPSFFPELSPLNPNSDSKVTYLPSTMFELYTRDCEGLDTFEDIENHQSDFIVDYCYLKLMYPERLRICMGKWRAVSEKEYTVFYTTDFTETPRILASVKVDSILRVSVTLAGRLMDPLDLTWILPVNARLNRWSQLQMMLAVFGK